MPELPTSLNSVPCEMKAGQVPKVAQIEVEAPIPGSEIVAAPPELPPFKIPFTMEPDELPIVAQLVRLVPGSEIVIKPVVGYKTVLVTILVPRDANMRVVYGEIASTLHPPPPSEVITQKERL